MRCILLVLSTFCLLIFPIDSSAQVISKSDNKPNEVSIAVNHLDESQIVVGSNNFNLYVSSDSGHIWTEQEQQSSLGVFGDPSLFCDEKGIFYHAHLSKTPGKERPDYFDRIVVQRSMDGGNTWNDGTGVGFNQGKMQDKEWLSGDLSEKSPFYGNIYLSWTEFDVYGSMDTSHHSRIRFATSTNKGLNFSEPVIVSDGTGDCKDDDGTLEGATAICTADGTIYVVWAGKGKIWMDMSTDGGKSFGKDQVLATLNEGWTIDVKGIYRCNGMPFIACDPVSGKVYVTYADRIDEGSSRIFILSSIDGTKSWKKEIRGNAKSGDAFFPNIVINPKTGVFGLVYYQCIGRRKLRTDLLLFGEDSTMQVIPLCKAFRRPGKKIFFGDYIDLDYYQTGFVVAWTSYEKRRLLVRMKIVPGNP